MIRYKCAHCGVELETDDLLSGKQEPCPDCGKVNVVPLSKHDLAKQKTEQKAKQKEKLQQERLREEAEQRKQALDAQHAAEERGRLAKEEQLGMTSTEEALGIIAGIYIILGVLGAVILIGVAAHYEQPLYGLGALMVLATSVLWAVLFFAAQCVLQYLRRITNVIEGGK